MINASAARAEVELPRPSETETIRITYDSATRWSEGSYEVWHLHGNAHIGQGAIAGRGDEAILWIKRGGEFGDRQNLVIAYLEGNARVDYQRAGFPYQLTDNVWLGEFFSAAPIEIRGPPAGAEPQSRPEIYARAQLKRDPEGAKRVQRTQFQRFDEPPAEVIAAPTGTRRIRAFPRSDVKVQVQWFPSADGQEWIALVTNGVNLVIDGIDELGLIDISADRVVIWTRGYQQPDLSNAALQSRDTPLEIYMEGNIVFRQGDRAVFADRMFYDVNREVGTVLDGEVNSPVPNFSGLIRMKAQVLQQTGRGQFYAREASFTSSRLAEPTYQMKASDVFFEDVQRPLYEPFTGALLVNPETGQPEVAHQQLLTSEGNKLYLGPVPVFYWPRFATDLQNPSYYIRRVAVRNDQVFGTQILADWDVWQFLGATRKPQGTDWTLSTDYLSMRGFGHGTNFNYNRDLTYGIPGLLDLSGFGNGFQDYYGIQDHGNDRLGQGRLDVPPEKLYRWRWLGHHRQLIFNDWRFTGELGWISDRNFLEQYFESEFDTHKDETTGFEIKKLFNNQSLSVNADARLNAFFTQTNWYPRLNHSIIGQQVFGTPILWHESSSAAYAKMGVATTPEDPQQAADQVPLPWEVPATGERFITAHEFDLPFNAGPFKFTPYAMGQYGHWGQVIDGSSSDRLYGQFGVRGSIPFHNVYPYAESSLWNVHGIAHKLLFHGDLYYADANQNVTDYPLFDPLDDDVQELFTRRFTVSDYGGVIPTQFDNRNYAVRSGIGSWVTNPTPEVLDDLKVFRLGLNQRWQTKRGPLDNRRIIDWITLDTNASLFPEPNQDNFGQTVGLANYNFRWHVGDRVTVLSDGMFDFFSNGQKIVSLGGSLSRPPRSLFYAGVHSIAGPINYNLLTTSYFYQLSPKWIWASGTQMNLNGLDVVGNNVSVTRVGESFLTTFNFVYDRFKDNVGVSLAIQPRFLPFLRTSGGMNPSIPALGMYGFQ